jgi:hypothetical protein
MGRGMRHLPKRVLAVRQLNRRVAEERIGAHECCHILAWKSRCLGPSARIDVLVATWEGTWSGVDEQGVSRGCLQG